MIGYLAPAVTRLLQAVQHVYQVSARNFTTTLSLPDKGVPVSGSPPFDGSSTGYIEKMYNTWIKDPKSVHASWDEYFRSATKGGTGYMKPPTFEIEDRFSPKPQKFSHHTSLDPNPTPTPIKVVPPSASSPGDSDSQSVEEHMSVHAIIRNYQALGHLVARTSPLEDMFDINDKNTTLSQKTGKQPPEIISYHKLTSSMWDNPFQLPRSTLIGGAEKKLPLKEIIKRLELSYCRHIGVEYMHINNLEEREWIRQKFEAPGVIELKNAEKKLILNRLCKSVLFEAFLQKKWSAQKRFGLEGCDVMVPCLKIIIDETALNNSEMAIIGMAHRGRLNVLANVCHKPLAKIFCQFHGLKPEDEGAGDVKYHWGVYDKRTHPATKKTFTTVLIANPSHLEAVNPVCAGRAKAEQFFRNDTKGDKVSSIIIHGDAAFAGLGVVYETINFANLKHYHNGGTIHIIANNQVGFTTDPKDSRSFFYCTDLGKALGAPIFHVNADDPESAVYVAKVAAQYRNKFHKDVIIDIVGYRRFGHNELDEPALTQPLMYKQIRQMPNIFVKYSQAAIKEGVVTEAEVKSYVENYEKSLEEDYNKAAKETTIRFGDWIDSPWPGFFKNKDTSKCEPTGISMDVLQHIAKKYSEPPPGDFELHKVVTRALKMRQEMIKNQVVDYSIGEALAIGSLLKEGIHVRLSGQDVQRGTFTHRHHVVHHQSKANTKHRYLTDLYPQQALYTVCNSPISEYGIVGFEHGYSMARPDCLVMWEAQFGDFSNNAMPIYDCLVASGQWKWVRQCGLVSLLPHGQEGQGPEHSSARIERFLQASSDDPDYLPPDSADFVIKQLREINWIIINCTVPATIFHALRRQIKLPFRKPLVIFTPKSLLRHPEARSKFDDMKEGTELQRLIPASGPASQNPDNVKRLIFCTGKVYYDFMKTIREKKLEDKIAIARVEQICPFPFDLVQKEIKKYSKAQLAWGQEEPKNAGCWTYVAPRFETALKGQKDIKYIGRAPLASTASGNKVLYEQEYSTLMKDLIKNL